MPLYNRYRKGRDAEEQARWDARAAGLKQSLEDFKRSSESTDRRILAKMDEMQDAYMTALKEQTDGLRDATLNSHLRTLIRDSKMYIERGYILPVELEDYEEQCRVYSSLGGNGHMDIWRTKVEALPNNPPA